jgi:toxin ParE1/3/4
VIGRYFVRPKADQDLDEQSEYLATQASPEIGHRFLMAAHDTFALLAKQPGMGRRSKLKHPELSHMRVFRVSGFERIVVPYLPRAEGIEILRVVHASRDLQAPISREGFE